MHEQNAKPIDTSPYPTLSLVGVPFSFVALDEPSVAARGTARLPIWTAIRAGEVWKIWWNGPASLLELHCNDSLVWSSHVEPDGEPLRDLVAYRAIISQFVDPARMVPGAGASQPSILGRAAERLIAQVNTPRALLRSAGKLLRAFLMFMGAVLCVTMLTQCKARNAGVAQTTSNWHADTASPSERAAKWQASPDSSLPPELRDRTLGEALSPTEMQVVANATREMGIQMRPSGQPFVIFSDPNCPSCKDLELKLSQVDPRFVPVIVPVSFKDGSEETVKRVLCAKDTVSAWSAAIGGYAPVGDAVSDGNCPGASDKALKANGAFVALNFSGTPTLVSATGRVIAGSGSLDDINKWLVANGGLKADAPLTPVR